MIIDEHIMFATKLGGSLGSLRTAVGYGTNDAKFESISACDPSWG